METCSFCQNPAMWLTKWVSVWSDGARFPYARKVCGNHQRTLARIAANSAEYNQNYSAMRLPTR